jgi:hypothetical protein
VTRDFQALAEIEQLIHERHLELSKLHKDAAQLLQREGAVRADLLHLVGKRKRLMQLQGGSHEKTTDDSGAADVRPSGTGLAD